MQSIEDLSIELGVGDDVLSEKLIRYRSVNKNTHNYRLTHCRRCDVPFKKGSIIFTKRGTRYHIDCAKEVHLISKESYAR